MSRYFIAMPLVSRIEPGTLIETLIGQTNSFLKVIIKKAFTKSPTIGNLERFQLDIRIYPDISISGGDKKQK